MLVPCSYKPQTTPERKTKYLPRKVTHECTTLPVYSREPGEITPVIREHWRVSGIEECDGGTPNPKIVYLNPLVFVSLLSWIPTFVKILFVT